jgi:uncharacterized protein
VITSGNLENQSKAELVVIAKRLGVDVAGKSKEMLVAAIARNSKNGKASNKSKGATKKPMPKSSPKSIPKAQGKKMPAKPAPKVKAAAKAKPAVKAAVKPVTIKKSPSKTVPPKKTSVPASKPVKPASKVSGVGKPVDKTQENKHSTGVKSAKQVVTKPTAPAPTKPTVTPVTTNSASKSIKEPVAAKKPAKVEKPAPVSTTNPKVLKKIREMQLQREATKDIGFRTRLVKPPGATDPVFEKEPQKDRIALFVRDPFWLHASWDITRGAVERAQAALAEQWYGARPVLRLIRIDDSGATSVAETVQSEIEIRGGVRNWYIPWTGETASFRVNVGYLGVHGRYHVIAQSNIVRTPAFSSPEAVDQHWTDLGAEGERIYAMSGGYDSERETGELQEMLEERLNRSLGAPTLAKLGAAADAIYQRRSGFHFDMDVELVVYGSTSPDAYLTLNEEPVALRPDGTFVVRLPFPDRRQVIPAVAVARDGSHQRTIVVGVERNTKIMEPMEQEQDLGE